MDTSWWLGQRHQVAREAGAAGVLLGVARGGEGICVNQIGQVLDLYPAIVQTAAPAVEAMLTAEGKGLAPLTRHEIGEVGAG